MKKCFLVSLLTVSLFAISTVSQAQISFSVSPGLNLNGATFGYVINDKIVPYVGIQLLMGNFTQSDEYMDWDSGAGEAVKETDEMKVSGSILAPTLGVKAYIFGQEKLKGYVNAAFTKPFISGKLSFDGEVEDEVGESIDKISLFGLQAGFGAEYFIDSNFSVSGEFGLAYMSGNYKDNYEGEYYNNSSSVWVDYKGTETIKLNMIPTYSRISLNFYF